MKDYNKAQSNGETYLAPIEGRVALQEVLTAATTLTAADSGKTLILKAEAGKAVALPALAAGLFFKVVVGLAFGTSNWVFTATSKVIFGGAIVNSVRVPSAGTKNTISFVNTAETLGDHVILECDGTNWYVSGVGASAGSITFTDV